MATIGEVESLSSRLRWPERCVYVGVAFAASLILFFQFRPSREQRDIEAGSNAVEAMEQLAYFCHDVHRFTVALAAGWTMLIYWFAYSSGWLDRIQSNRLRGVLTIPFMGLTGLTAIHCWRTVTDITQHWIALTLFFGVFVLWDGLIWIAAKRPHDVIAVHCERRVFHWLWRVDIATPVILWSAYGLVRTREPAGALTAGGGSTALLLTGVAIALLLVALVDWLVALVAWWE